MWPCTEDCEEATLAQMIKIAGATSKQHQPDTASGTACVRSKQYLIFLLQCESASVSQQCSKCDRLMPEARRHPCDCVVYTVCMTSSVNDFLLAYCLFFSYHIGSSSADRHLKRLHSSSVAGVTFGFPRAPWYWARCRSI